MIDEEPIPLSALQHVSYCPRQYALIHIEQEFSDNVHTMRGHASHEKVDSGLSGFLPSGAEIRRSLPLFSIQHNLIGKADVVEFYPDSRIFPVEYKQGRRQASKQDNIQLAAQAMCLEEMFSRSISVGAIYHVSSNKRREVEINDALRDQVKNAIEVILQIRRSGQLPLPIYDTRCKECSLKPICQPELIHQSLKQEQQEWYHLFKVEEEQE